MRNIKLTIAYEGTKYVGWQRQTSHQSPVTSHQSKTIQEEIEKALQEIFRKHILLVGSGRTDAGVHAIAQVANFKIDNPMHVDRIKKALNGLLPRDIVITDAQEAGLDFHARFCAKSKTYRYLIFNTSSKINFVRSLGLWVRFPLNVALMRRESRCLLGRHDFKSFQASDTRERDSVTTIYRVNIKKCKASNDFPFLSSFDSVVIDIEASGFLRNMVRNVVGTLIEIGQGKLKIGDLEKIIKKKDRRLAGFCAPAFGLYLLYVSYD